MDHGALKQAGTKTAPARFFQHRDTKLSALLVLRFGGKGDVRHRNQFEVAVVNAKNFVALKVQLFNIAVDLVFVGVVAKAQVAVRVVQRQQVRGNALAVGRAEGANWHHDGCFDRFTRGGSIAASTVAHRVQQINASAPGCFEPVFGCSHVKQCRLFFTTFQVLFAALQQSYQISELKLTNQVLVRSPKG